MKIGIDLSPLQGPHRMRGIGYTLINFLNNISAEDRAKNTFIFFLLPGGDTMFPDPIKLLDVENISYEVRYKGSDRNLQPKKRGVVNLIHVLKTNFTKSHQYIQRTFFPHKVQRFFTLTSDGLKKILLVRRGNAHLKHALISDIDVYLEFDPGESLPAAALKNVLLIYDIIPYVLEWDYLWSYHTARQHGFSRQRSMRCSARRWFYVYKLRVNAKRSRVLLAISEQTKQDFVKYIGTPPDKIVVTPLGVNKPREQTDATVDLCRYTKTSWGYKKHTLNSNLLDKPFLLFIGGADRRRKIQDLVTAFNMLRAQGHLINLVLAGDSMQGPESIATEEIQEALKTSSYLEDIIFMGFVDDQQRDWLYKHALAYIFPSRYEGFGLPVLEAMAYGCPVISYKNKATLEVAGDTPIYAGDAVDLYKAILELLAKMPEEKNALLKKGSAQVQKHGWAKTSRQIFQVLDDIT